MKKILPLALLSLMTLTLSACSAEVGSDAWCAKMKEKPSGDWSANEAADYTKHCVFK
ncbi:MAG: DUF3012 domain-containing protein [Pseudomonadales bacterium]